ncbi:MAG: HEAT repeat domain-containing protein [Thiohalospira sp.]
MECKNIQNLMIDFIDRNISGDKKDAIEKHLLECEACRNEHKQMLQMFNDLNIVKDEKPDNHLKSDFYAMLENEKKQLVKIPTVNLTNKNSQMNWSFIKYAATTIILIGIGFLLGQQMQVRNNNQAEIAMLRKELYEMQQNLSMASLTHSTASQRLKAVNTISEQLAPDNKMIDVLINALNNDDNINVKMAAANALSKYPENQEVRNELIESLENEEEPALQITLISILTQIQDKKAKKAFQNILQNENTIPVVKQQAEEGLKVFI